MMMLFRGKLETDPRLISASTNILETDADVSSFGISVRRAIEIDRNSTNREHERIRIYKRDRENKQFFGYLSH